MNWKREKIGEFLSFSSISQALPLIFFFHPFLDKEKKSKEDEGRPLNVCLYRPIRFQLDII